DRLQARVLALELLEPLGVVGLHPAVLVAPAVIRVLADLQGLGDLGDRLALAEHPVRLAQLADDLLGRVPASLHRESLLAHDRGREELSQAPDRTYGVTPPTGEPIVSAVLLGPWRRGRHASVCTASTSDGMGVRRGESVL